MLVKSIRAPHRPDSLDARRARARSAAMARGEYGCMFWMLAITNTMVLGGAAFLAYAIAGFARSHNTGGGVGLSILLVLWVSIGSSLYCAFCSGLVVLFVSRARPPTQMNPLPDPPTVRPRRRRGFSDDGDDILLFFPDDLIDSPGAGMNPLPPEPEDILAYKQPGGAHPDGDSRSAPCASARWKRGRW